MKLNFKSILLKIKLSYNSLFKKKLLTKTGQKKSTNKN